jgi:hypothetical protein
LAEFIFFTFHFCVFLGAFPSPDTLGPSAFSLFLSAVCRLLPAVIHRMKAEFQGTRNQVQGIQQLCRVNSYFSLFTFHFCMTPFLIYIGALHSKLNLNLKNGSADS